MKSFEEIIDHLNNLSFADKIDIIQTTTLGPAIRIQTWFCYRDGDVIDLYLYVKETVNAPLLMLSDLGMTYINFSSQMINSPDDVPDFEMITNFNSLKYAIGHMIANIYHYEARFIKKLDLENRTIENKLNEAVKLLERWQTSVLSGMKNVPLDDTVEFLAKVRS